MRILLIHNFYQQPGGEDRVFYSEKALLEKRGHQVDEFTRHNEEIRRYNSRQKIALMGKTVRNKAALRELHQAAQAQRPDILHFHNTFPLISPAVYSVGTELNIPVIQTVHNYRFFCANGLFYRDSRVCEDCFGKRFPLPALLHACYRNSRLQTLPAALLQAYHHQQKTWQTNVDAFIALSEFSKQKFVQAGFDPEKIFVKPNFIYSDPGERTGNGNYALFLGRLSAEKGIHVLLKAWKELHEIPLKIAGDGPLFEYCRKSANNRIELLGRVDPLSALELMKNAKFLVLPSTCYENFPMTIAEAYACGTPVIASRLGALGEIVPEGKTGLLFTPGNPADLAEKVRRVWEHSEQVKEMSKNARKEYESKYTAEQNYQILMDIYRKALEGKREK